MPARGHGALDAETQHLLDVIDPKQYQSHIKRLLAREEAAIKAEAKSAEAGDKVRHLTAEQQAAAIAARNALEADHVKWKQELVSKEKNLLGREQSMANKLKRHDQDTARLRDDKENVRNREKAVKEREQKIASEERRIAEANQQLDRRVKQTDQASSALANAEGEFRARQEKLKTYMDGFRFL